MIQIKIFVLNGSDLKKDRMDQTLIRSQIKIIMMTKKIRLLRLKGNKMKKRNSRKISRRGKNKSAKDTKNRNKINLNRKEQMTKNKWLMDIF